VDPRAPGEPGRRSQAGRPGLAVDDITGIASLAEPTRRALYLYVRAQALRGAARGRGHILGDEVRRRAGSRSSQAAQLTASQAAQLTASQAAQLTAVREVLDEEGYETRPGPAGLILANCPFRVLSRDYTTVVCGMNLAIMEGLLDRLEQTPLTALLDPAEGRCCVRLVAPESTPA
jgi:predicted ArsR family transcriptional regulator